MSQINFDATALNNIINKAKASVKDTETPKGEFVSMSFLNAGKHKIRFFIDPEGELMRDIAVHQFRGKKTLCPRFLDKKLHPELADLPLDDKGNHKCEICQFAWDIDDWQSGLSTRRNIAIYGYLYESDKTNDYWVPNKPYLIVAKTKLKTAIISFLESLAKDAPDYVLTMLNPTNPGPFVNIEVIGGTQGSINITPIPGASKPPIEIGEWYRPLRNSYIAEHFSFAAYSEALEAAKEVNQEYLDEEAANPKTESATTQTTEEAPATQEVESSSTQATDQAATSAPVTTTQDPVTTPAVTTEQAPPATTSAPTGLNSNQVMTRTNRVVTLPANVMERGCWTKQNNQDPACVICPINLECMYESASVG